MNENIQQSTFTVTKLNAKDGFYLTQNHLENENFRIYCKFVFLATDQSPEDWREATEDEKINFEKTKEQNMANRA